MSSEEYYLRRGNSIVGFSGKDVLKVGGRSNPQLIEIFSPKSWTAVDINPKTVLREGPYIKERGIRITRNELNGA